MDNNKKCGKRVERDWINLEYSLSHFDLGCKAKSILKRKVVNAWHGFYEAGSVDQNWMTKKVKTRQPKNRRPNLSSKNDLKAKNQVTLL